MSELPPLPFETFSFTLIEDKRPRKALRMKALDEGFYELHFEKGSAANPISQFTRQVPLASAQKLKDALQEAGVFGWEESYGDVSAPGQMRWSVSTVFKAGVFSVASKGGSDTPQGFEALLEELYRLDFPRPESSPGTGRSAGALGIGGEFAQFMGGAGSDGGFGQLSDLMNGAGMQGLDASEMMRLLEEARANPQALQQRMRDEFKHLPHDEQERMLDALASSGMASRAWWERFLRG